ncbi:iron uptake transporter permease EfeU [Patulibacter brassicae]|jgi:high-affinity iron transporter|uniref:Iron uptake transporter permease EfeU n=1 Tax=Patulibacter brassicae TaxID=1705717 RepID=A0ABU4VRF8_9ACTN|nr:iron uptake transporter permease EfeU [Patulibacter brassicae]MDX8153694.1 iron uptake transporter permease EfeU [Patulibacter brassicae]
MSTLATLPVVQFVIGLREGVEASLIVGIIAAFLVQQGRRDLLRYVWIGVSIAVLICIGVGVGLEIAGENLPQKQQEGFESIVALVAVGMVTTMIIWMRKHARTMASELRASTAAAIATGSSTALVVMAFFAVLREGFETAVFIVPYFSADLSAAGYSRASVLVGVTLGLLLAALIGWGIYRGGVRINLTRFFKITGAFLVVVAAGLVASAAHSAFEAGWYTSLQHSPLDLSSVIEPNAENVFSNLVTALLGIRPHPSWAEIIGWAAYAVPMLAFVLWPERWRRGTPAQAAAPQTA